MKGGKLRHRHPRGGGRGYKITDLLDPAPDFLLSMVGSGSSFSRRAIGFLFFGRIHLRILFPSVTFKCQLSSIRDLIVYIYYIECCTAGGSECCTAGGYSSTENNTDLQTQ